MSKFTVNLLQTAPKFLRSTAFYSTSKISTLGDRKKQPKDWRLEVAGPCENDQILCFVEKNFFKEEPLFKALMPCPKPKILQKLIRGSLDQGLTIVARKCSEDKEILGVCINERSCKLDGAKYCKMVSEVEDCGLKKLFEVLSILHREPKLYEKLCQDEIFLVSMLTVAEKHYGRGIGLAMVQQSLELARDKKFEYAQILCTSDNTRKIADKLQMEKIWAAPYKDILCRGNIKPRALPAPPHNCAKVYYMDLKNLSPKC